MLLQRRRHILHKRNTITTRRIFLSFVRLRVHGTSMHTVKRSIRYDRRDVVAWIVPAARVSEDVAIIGRVSAFAVLF
jgi:hypothetical protein